MGNLDFEKIIRQFSSYFDIELKSLTFLFDKIPSVVLISKDKILGLRNLVSQVSKPLDPECEAIQNEWVEYVLTNLGSFEPITVQQMLKDLNSYLSDKVYFVGNNFGPLDILMYYFLHDVTSKLTFQEKEKYLHFSRWFNYIQHSKDASPNKSLIPFSKSLLSIPTLTKFHVISVHEQGLDKVQVVDDFTNTELDLKDKATLLLNKVMLAAENLLQSNSSFKAGFWPLKE